MAEAKFIGGQRICDLTARDKIEELYSGADFNLSEYLALASEYTMTFAAGQTGGTSGASPAVVSSPLFSCSDLIPVSNGDILTIINLMPEKYRFAVRGYTENVDNSGVFVTGSAKILNADLTDSGEYTTSYSNTRTAIYKNEIAVITPIDTVKYLAINTRRITSDNRADGDVEEIQKAFRVYYGSPKVKNAFIPTITSDMRSRLGDSCFMFAYKAIRIDTVNKTMTSDGTITVKSGSYRKNNPTVDFSALDTSVYQTIYFDFADGSIKIVGYGQYESLTGKENTAYLGSIWIANDLYPNGYFALNTNMEIYVNGIKQLPFNDYFLGKKMSLFGDSICWGRTTSDGRTSYLLHEIIGKQLGILATNYAVGGSCIAARSGHASDICKLIDTVTISDDFFLIFAGTNDYGSNVPLGTIDDAPSNTDGNTFYSAVKYCIEHIIMQKPDAEIGIVTPTFRNYQSNGGVGNTYTTIKNSANATLGDYCDALVEVGRMYNIPVYDMRDNSPINHINYASMLEQNSSGNGLYLHPKNATYKILNRKICAWIASSY